MTKSISSLLIILISLLTVINQVSTKVGLIRQPVKGHQTHWLTAPALDRNDLLKKWIESKRGEHQSDLSKLLPLDSLHTTQSFKGCIDPSEPFQCPQSERCIALQFICDGHPGDCPGNLDENEETCIAAKRPAKENIEKFFHASYTLHGIELFKFLFGERIAKNVEENQAFWFDTLASAFSVAKNLRSFAQKTRMSPQDLEHFKNVIQIIYDGRLEEIPLFAQEAVNQGLASLIEKLYESGFMEQ